MERGIVAADVLRCPSVELVSAVEAMRHEKRRLATLQLTNGSTLPTVPRNTSMRQKRISF